MKGYAGKILQVDLSKNELKVENIDEALLRKYLGGSCLAMYYILNGMDPNADALSGENVIVFAISPTAGARVAGSSRLSVTAKSPLTDMIGVAESGGFAAADLKFAGLDAIVIKGKSDTPVYLSIVDDDIRLRDAAKIWGKYTGDAQAIMREEIGQPSARSILIGPAGENMVRYANVAVDLSHFAGRCGLGAVMGSKNFKGIIVKGNKKPEFDNRELLDEMQKRFISTVKEPNFYKDLGEFGTPVLVPGCNDTGNLPTRNWSAGSYEDHLDIGGEMLNKTYLKGTHSCWACAMACKRKVEITEGPYIVDVQYGGPEYETLGMCGSNLGINDLAAICKINEICNKTGMDTISFGGTIGFIMDAFEHGCITTNDTQGVDIRFGDTKKVVELCEETAFRKGFGDVIAEGTKRVADTFPTDAAELAVHIKGKELPAHTPQAKPTFAIAYSVLPYGPDHVSCEADGLIGTEPIPESVMNFGLDTPASTEIINIEKVKLFKTTQLLYSLGDSLPVCAFCFGMWTVFTIDDLVSFINACTGWNASIIEYMRIAERRVNMMTAFNALAGYSAKDNVLPPKFYKPMEDYGASANKLIDKKALEQAHRDYYLLCGWSDDGIPRKTKLDELGLQWINNMDPKGIFK